MACWPACFSQWQPSEELQAYYLPKNADYRDSLPLDFATVRELYKPYVQEGRWVFGLFNMWHGKSKPVKRSVHVPCWDSFKFNPLRWRGVVAGRTCRQCYWTGLHETRWARSAYAGALGRKYLMGVQNPRASTKGLCLVYFVLSLILGFGITQVFTRLGSCNFAACYSCWSRARMRRAFKLPPTFGLPYYIDDCCVHFACTYCASHQEIRELAVRGVDGPGMHILDFLSDAYKGVEGIEELVAARQAAVADMMANPPRTLQLPRKKQAVPGPLPADGGPKEVSEEGSGEEAAAAAGGSKAGAAGVALGWAAHLAPAEQEMER